MTTIAPSKPNLTSNDSAVLQALFDAESSPSPSSSHVTTDASLPPLPHVSPSILPSLQAREREAIAPLNTPENEKPETSAVKTAIQALSAIIEETPDYASAYVNRAQAYRLLIDAEIDVNKANTPPPSETTEVCASLLSDLARSITLLTPSNPTAPVSPLTARILANAHTHRAYLLYRAARAKANTSASDTNSNSQPTPTPQKEENVSVSVSMLPSHLREMSPDALEEMASYDFTLGGRYGNPVAKELAVRTNPYAKMCGAIVRDAMRAEIEGWMNLNGKNKE